MSMIIIMAIMPIMVLAILGEHNRFDNRHILQLQEIQEAIDDHYTLYGKYPDNCIDPQKANYKNKKDVRPLSSNKKDDVYYFDKWGTPFQYDKESGYVYSLGEDKVKSPDTDSKRKVVGEGDYDAKSQMKK